jgi:hypothetical protein
MMAKNFIVRYNGPSQSSFHHIIRGLMRCLKLENPIIQGFCGILFSTNYWSKYRCAFRNLFSEHFLFCC